MKQDTGVENGGGDSRFTRGLEGGPLWGGDMNKQLNEVKDEAFQTKGTRNTNALMQKNA